MVRAETFILEHHEAHLHATSTKIKIYQNKEYIANVSFGWWVIGGTTNKNNSTAGAVQPRHICRGHPLPTQFFYNKCITKKCFTLKMKVKVTEYANRNGHIPWQISKSIKVILENFCASSYRLRDGNILSFWPW